jgi:hypothetical protein
LVGSTDGRTTAPGERTGRKVRITATISDLARIDWSALERQWGKSPANWNHLRRSVSRFFTLALDDKWHPLRRQVMRRFPTRVETDREPDLTIEDFVRTRR